jgi:putative CocE/NonD family hydrolase
MALETKMAAKLRQSKLMNNECNSLVLARSSIAAFAVATVFLVLLTSAAQSSEGRKPDKNTPENVSELGASPVQDALREKPGQKPSIAQMTFRLGDRAVPDLSKTFKEKTDLMLPMRDGVKLHTEIYIPRGPKTAGPWPIMLERTPFYANPNEEAYSSRLKFYTEFFDDDYIWVLQDLRGRYLSEGVHVLLRPQRDKTVPGSTDESTDFYDTIEWLVKNVPNNNGRVGTLGISYGGFLSTRAMIDPHPALKAVSPQATCAEMFTGDDWHHNGAFRLEYSFNAALRLETQLTAQLVEDKRDNYEYFLELGPLSNVNDKYFHRRAPTWNAFMEHPNYDSYWEYGNCSVLPYMKEVTVPALHVVGWFDTEDFYGPLQVYKKLEKEDRNNTNFLIIGPWYHGSWTFESIGRKLRGIDFGSDTSVFFQQQIHRKWFAYWLKGEGQLDFPEALVFRTGSNVWESFSKWPPTHGIEERRLYLREGHALAFDPSTGDGSDAFDSYVSDPAKPVPYLPRPIHYPFGWFTWTLEDQRFVDHRPDVLTWTSQPLLQDLTVTGDIVAHLFASTSGQDSDWVVKLIDVYPDNEQESWDLRGYEMLVAGEVFRARYRKNFERPEPVRPGEVLPYEINLRARNHTFLRGHRLMVQIQSSWFPLIDRNPQTWVPSIYTASDKDFIKTTQRIYRSGQYSTYISLPVRTIPPSLGDTPGAK